MNIRNQESIVYPTEARRLFAEIHIGSMGNMIIGVLRIGKMIVVEHGPEVAALHSSLVCRDGKIKEPRCIHYIVDRNIQIQ